MSIMMTICLTVPVSVFVIHKTTLSPSSVRRQKVLVLQRCSTILYPLRWYILEDEKQRTSPKYDSVVDFFYPHRIRNHY